MHSFDASTHTITTNSILLSILGHLDFYRGSLSDVDQNGNVYLQERDHTFTLLNFLYRLLDSSIYTQSYTIKLFRLFENLGLADRLISINSNIVGVKTDTNSISSDTSGILSVLTNYDGSPSSIRILDYSTTGNSSTRSWSSTGTFYNQYMKSLPSLLALFLNNTTLGIQASNDVSYKILDSINNLELDVSSSSDSNSTVTNNTNLNLDLPNLSLSLSDFLKSSLDVDINISDLENLDPLSTSLGWFSQANYDTLNP